MHALKVSVLMKNVYSLSLPYILCYIALLNYKGYQALLFDLQIMQYGVIGQWVYLLTLPCSCSDLLMNFHLIRLLPIVYVRDWMYGKMVTYFS